MKDEVLCIICAKPVDTLEISEGGSPGGCEIQGNIWVCSRECYDDAMRIGTDEDEPDEFCSGCHGGDRWPASEAVWRCPVCDAEYWSEDETEEPGDD